MYNVSLFLQTNTLSAFKNVMTKNIKELYILILAAYVTLHWLKPCFDMFWLPYACYVQIVKMCKKRKWLLFSYLILTYLSQIYAENKL